ncbi:MAG: BNR-4 repeat-containing protein [Candidatus Hodarchaeales archaeon]
MPNQKSFSVTKGVQTELSSKLKSITVPVASDSDDDFWTHYNIDDTWSHTTNFDYVRVHHKTSDSFRLGQFRFKLVIPQGTTIQYATITFWSHQVQTNEEATIKRINETNVGPLESDSIVPTVTEKNQVIHDFSIGVFKYTTTLITDLVNDQVNLPEWQSGYYFGLQVNMTTLVEATENYFADYQLGDGREAYMNITYTENVGWLNGWANRQTHFIPSNINLGTNNTIPLSIYLGYGVDSKDRIFIEDGSQSIFDEIRFTSNDGQTLIDSWLKTTIEEQTIDFFTNYSLQFANYPKNYPAGWYFNNRTYVVFQGNLDFDNPTYHPNILYYDHENHSWSQIYNVAENPKEDDDHGSPCMWIDNAGYIHVTYGAHGSKLKHAKSDRPEDITSFSIQKDITSQYVTYPVVSYDSENDVVHIYYRGLINKAAQIGYIGYSNSTDNGQTWRTNEQLIEFDYAPIPWGGNGIDPYNPSKLHISWVGRTFLGGPDENVYYAYLNVSTGVLYNASGFNLGTKIDVNESAESTLVWDSSDCYVGGLIVHSDHNSNPYLIFTSLNDTLHSYATTMYMYWTGSEWSSIQKITAIPRVLMSTDFIVHSPTNISAYLNDGWNLRKYNWNGNNWRLVDWIFNTTEFHSFSTVPINYHDDLQITFTEWKWNTGGTPPRVRAYAWGTKGILPGSISKHAKFIVELISDVREFNQVIYLYYSFKNDSPPIDDTSSIPDITSSPLTISIPSPQSVSNKSSIQNDYIATVDSDLFWISTIALNNILFFGFYQFKKGRKILDSKKLSKPPNLKEIFQEE